MAFHIGVDGVKNVERDGDKNAKVASFSISRGEVWGFDSWGLTCAPSSEVIRLCTQRQCAKPLAEFILL